jgi:hypothetical protein
MAEQLANLFSTTLAAPYVAGSGAITVASASGAPSSGTFSLTILDASTGDVILIFRVTSLASVVFSGASEGSDSNAASGSIVVGTQLTAAAIEQLFLDHPGSIQPLTPPSSGALTDYNFNVGSGVTTTQVNNTSPAVSITLVQDDPSTTENIAAIGKNKLASTFTLTIALSAFTDAQNFAGLWLSDGTNNIIFGNQGGNGLRASYFSSFDSYAGDVISPQSSAWGLGPLMWLRIQETVSARNYSVSSDGITFIELFTESNTAHLTTAQYGFAVEVRNNGFPVMATCYSFVETNP